MYAYTHIYSRGSAEAYVSKYMFVFLFLCYEMLKADQFTLSLWPVYDCELPSENLKENRCDSITKTRRNDVV